MLSEAVISQRQGQVLLKDTILKDDHFQGSRNTKLVPSFEDAPNFRKISDMPIYGVAIPTLAGFRIVLDMLHGKSKRVVWHNLREEPLIYINGHPYVVRDVDNPFANLELTGINRHRVEAMEQRLKQDVVKETKQYGGRVLITLDNEEGEIFFQWEDVSPPKIQTPQDIVSQLVGEGYKLDYLRVPVTDEKAPKEIDCDLVAKRCWESDKETSLVFNCQMGRGRTTTGMVIAALVLLRKQGTLTEADREGDAPEWLEKAPSPGSRRSGNFLVVRSLLRILESGCEAKRLLDSVLDAASHMQNLRGAIYNYKDLLCREHNERKKNSLLRAALEYLERYCVLIAFAAYISGPQFDPASSRHVTFEAFLLRRPEFKSVLRRLLRRNPLSALGLHVSADPASKGVVRPSSIDGNLFGVANRREGNVLGLYTILKEDHFPGIEEPGVRQLIPGAPNFRGVTGLPVYGVGMPTLNGIRSVLHAVQQPGSPSSVLWINWREEPLVYINGRPFVLREARRPFKNLKEYTNINARNLEEMERRLKEDVIQEAGVNDGYILVALEAPSEESHGKLVDKWEKIENMDSVQTPAEVYSGLQIDGFDVDYLRLPLTDGTTPDVHDVDQILSSIDTKRGAIIFNCQNGVGRTTVGMIITSLALQHNPSLISNPGVADYYPDNMQQNGLTRVLSTLSEMDEAWTSDSVDSADGSTSRTDINFLGIRRLTHLLHDGQAVKNLVDYYTDDCGLLVNIKTEIEQTRKAQIAQKPETSSKHIIYDRGARYLHRYCFLVAVAAYINGETLDGTFSQWIASRQDISLALERVIQNPSAALSPLLPRTVASISEGKENAVSAEEEQTFLAKRSFQFLNSKSILKGGRQVSHGSTYHSLSGMKRVKGRHIYTIGDPSVDSLRRLITRFTQESKTVVIRDTREELVIYINGIPYTRRDTDRPVSSLYHAGVSSKDLEAIEMSLKNDVKQEAMLNHGTILLHHEVSSDEGVSFKRDNQKDIITQSHQKGELGPAVVAEWGYINPGCCDGVFTVSEIYESFLRDGHRIEFARVPLSRGRTPQASDLDDICRDIKDPESVFIVVARSSTSSSARFAAAALSLVQPRDTDANPPLHLVDGASTKTALGEYKGIMNLCRALPNGLSCKATVDSAIDDCLKIGSLREDIVSCLYATDSSSQTRQLGLHYLQRYFFLIAYQSYRDHNGGELFSDWISSRKELIHLLSSLRLE